VAHPSTPPRRTLLNFRVPAAGRPDPCAFVSCEGSGFRRRAATTAPLNSCLATWSHAAEALRLRCQNHEPPRLNLHLNYRNDCVIISRALISSPQGGYMVHAARASTASAPAPLSTRQFLIGHAAIRNARNSPENNALDFSNRLKTANCSARFSPVLRSRNHQSRIAGHASPSANHQSLLTNHAFLFNTNKPHRSTILMRPLLKTKEKQFSIQYKSALRDIGLPTEAAPSLSLRPELNRFLRRSRANYLKIEIPFEVNDAASLVCAGSDSALRSSPKRPATQH